MPRFSKKSVPDLRYGVIHSQFGFSDGVSIVMKQVEEVLTSNLNIPKKNIFYLVGKSKFKSPQITQRRVLWDKLKTNRMVEKRYEVGFGGEKSEKIEARIRDAQAVIEDFVKKKEPDVLIVHNSSHPVNFISSVALSRYYRDSIKKGVKTPKYVLWWHDSHLERRVFSKPANDIKEYLLEGVPGSFVEYILFINSLQYNMAEKYFLELGKLHPGFYDLMQLNQDVVYNTTDTFIDSFEDLETDRFSERAEQFVEDFKIKELLKEHRIKLEDMFFCLQHTRGVERKRIDFALEYCFELFAELKKQKKCKAFYFFISGHSRSDGTRPKLTRLHKALSKKYDTTRFFLVFAEDFDKRTNIKFAEYPRIFAKLEGVSTYFSEVEGFGNNLLEVLASGLVPIIYTYPVFVKDIAKYNFKVIALDKFEVDKDSIAKTIDISFNARKRKIWVNKNLEILRKKFPHNIMSFKVRRAIIRRRTHK